MIVSLSSRTPGPIFVTYRISNNPHPLDRAFSTLTQHPARYISEPPTSKLLDTEKRPKRHRETFLTGGDILALFKPALTHPVHPTSDWLLSLRGRQNRGYVQHLTGNQWSVADCQHVGINCFHRELCCHLQRHTGLRL